MRALPVVVGLLIAVGACAPNTAAKTDRVASPSIGAGQTTATTATTGTTGTTATTGTTTTPTAETTSVDPPVFSSTVIPATTAMLGESWHAGCPVPVEELRSMTLTHWNNTGEAVDGVLIVHRDHVEDLMAVFAAIFESGFPIESIRPVTEFANNDDLSMAANNTSAFNCREISGQPGVWSQHSYGAAVDINPLVNPAVRGSRVDPPAAASYVDREREEPGLIHSGDVVTTAFEAIGWGWGGDWLSTKDYQHFSANGG